MRTQALQAEKTERQMRQVSPCRLQIHPPTLKMSSIWQEVWRVWQNELYQCSLQRPKTSSTETKGNEDGQINMVNTDHIIFNVRRSSMATELKTSIFYSSINVSYKLDTGSNSNRLLFHIFEIP